MNNSIYLIPIIIILFIFTCGFNVSAQCPSGDVTFTSQQEVDAFAVNYPNCTQINNSMRIGAYPNLTNITDLSPLNQIEIVGQSLYFYNNPLLTSLDGLENLFFIGGELDIRNNSALTDISAFSDLIHAVGVEIVNNSMLPNLEGLENLNGLGYLVIENNPLLSSLGDNLLNEESLNSLEIVYNDALKNLTGLEGITNVQGIVNIIGNSALTDLSGLENLAYVETINIKNNNVLNNLNGLQNLTDIRFLLVVENNSDLAICYTQGICDHLMNGGENRIQNNAPGCNSEEEVEASCIALPVELTQFTAAAQRGSILLKWQTASETNNQGFDIQRSKDGINWEKIGYQQGAGNSNTRQDYRHNDTQPLSSINYYRLKQIDVEGDFIYSDVVSVSYGNKGFAVFPVPAKDEITLQVESPQTTVGIRISNIIGEVIHVQELHLSEGVNQVTFDISEYTNGVYFLTIDNGDKNGTQRFVKH